MDAERVTKNVNGATSKAFREERGKEKNVLFEQNKFSKLTTRKE